MQLRLTTLAMAALAAFGAQPAAADCDPGEAVLNFSHVVSPTGHPKGEAAAEFARRLNRELNGRLCVVVHPNSSLFSDDDTMFAALASGELQMAAPSISKMSGFSKRFQVFDLPFLFPDLEAVTRFQHSAAGQALLAEMDPHGIHAFTYWHNGLRQMSAVRPLKSPEDVAGLTFRIQGSPVEAAQFARLGAATKKLKFSEVYDALAAGEVTGQENTWSNIYTKGFFKVQDSVTETNHSLIAYAVLGSARFFDNLDDDSRNTVLRTLAEVTHEYNRFAFEIGEMNRMRLVEAGGRVNQLDEQGRKAWVDAMLPVWDQFRNEIGQSLIEAAQGRNTGS